MITDEDDNGGEKENTDNGDNTDTSNGNINLNSIVYDQK